MVSGSPARSQDDDVMSIAPQTADQLKIAPTLSPSTVWGEDEVSAGP